MHVIKQYEDPQQLPPTVISQEVCIDHYTLQTDYELFSRRVNMGITSLSLSVCRNIVQKLSISSGTSSIPDHLKHTSNTLHI